MNSKQIFAESLEALLKKKNLDDIQVCEIVAGTHLSRRTFYRHFDDKYDLAGWYFAQFFEKSFGSITNGASWEDALSSYLSLYKDKVAILKNAYESHDVNGLRNIDIAFTKKTYETYLLQNGADTQSEIMQFAIDIASRGGTDMVIEWLMGGMKIEKEKLISLLKQTLPPVILRYLDK
ncbi:TetR/AcrR family transcriptional regulator [Lacrimispora sp. NSJ-141]|uniref:TetR/AcrR family transcriptional regulator n=1 Tax=Lientehia hominis TaxID=2897778 RepID=A0AAP2RK99_9FIRM|nr:TetR/AcrR family transcriptional regulator C-terminal domain-containing protein [Lientehia hominis]MCD2493567.1 TetR/AcrR family transcriptional regulator [Lientehia hominis]